MAQATEHAGTQDVEKILADWPEHPRENVEQFMEQYGPPDEATASRLIWHEPGKWKRAVAIRDPIPHEWPTPHKDIIKQTIAYKVPTDAFNKLAEFDGSVIVERTRGELSARCEMEEANYLAINLAHEIITGERTVEEAREEYTREMKAMTEEGTKGEYMKGFRFDLPTGDQRDPDEKEFDA